MTNKRRRRAAGGGKKMMLWAMVAVLIGMAAIAGAARFRVAKERRARHRDDGALYRVTRGQGADVVVLPGFLGTTRYFDSAFTPLYDGLRFTFIDPLGFGRSPWPAHGYTLDDHINALSATIDEVTSEPVVLVGHSTGAIYALAYARRHPDRVSRLLLLGLPVFNDVQDARARIRTLSPLADLLVLNSWVARMACDVVCAFRPAAAWLAERTNPERRAEVARDAVLHHWVSFRDTLKYVLVDHRVVGDVASQRSKVTLLHARDDEVTPIERVRELAQREQLTLIEIDGDHHAYRAPAEAWLREQLYTAPVGKLQTSPPLPQAPPL